jgi:hypothetical protein
MPAKKEFSMTKNDAWFDVKKGGSFLTMAAMAGWRLNSLSRNCRTLLRSHPFGCLNPWYRDRSPSKKS